MKIIYLPIVLLLIYSCAGVQLNYDYDRAYDFRLIKTYGFDSQMQSGLSELDHKRLIRILDSTLIARGYTYSETPQFLIDIKSETYRDQNGQNVGVGLGGIGGNLGGGVSIGLPINRTTIRRMITLNLVDFESNNLIWQATTDAIFKEKVTPNIREAQLRRVVLKSLSRFPPK